MAEDDVKAGGGRAVVETRLVIVAVGIGRRAIAVHQTDVVGVDDQTSAALLWVDWWSWAAEVVSRPIQFVTSFSEGGRVVPGFAWRQAHDFAAVAGN